MKRNLFLRLCLMIGVFSIAFSCKTELIHDENTNLTPQNVVAKQILFKELQKQAPQIALRVSKFSPANISDRTYTDSEGGFSIDTEKSLYIEDAKGNNTYSFKMTRHESDASVLENLVLKDIGNGQFEAYIATYDDFALNNYGNLTPENLKSHTKMVYIGDRLEAEIFGKANANQCYVTIFTGTTEVYVPGNLCAGGIHNLSHYDECPLPASQKPTQGYYTTVSTFDSYDMCQSGGSTTGSGDGGGGATGPYNPGGGFGSGANPCDKIKNTLVRNVLDVVPLTTVKGMLTHLKNNLPSTNPQIKGEISYAMFQDSNNELHAQYFEQTSEDQQIEFSLGIGYMYPVYMPTHTVNGLTIFSLADIFAIKQGIDNGNFNENTVFYLVTDNGTQYAMTITDLNSFTAWADTYFFGWEFDNIKKSKEDEYEEKVNLKHNIDQNESGLVNFFENTLVGIQLFKASSDFNTWQKLSYNHFTQKITKTNCPN